MNKPQLLCPSQCLLGEGPFCHAGQLYWFDILQSQFHQCDEQGNNHQVATFDEMFSAGAVLENNDLILASETALWQYHQASKQLTKLHDLEADNPVTRSNDGRVDRQGGFWIGTMGKEAEHEAGAIYRYFRGELRCLRNHVTIPNAICFSPTGDTAYFVDSVEKIIYSWALDDNGWPQGEATVFVDLSDQLINPDGAVMDSEGYLWNAQWDGAQVIRYTPSGDVDQIIDLPVTRPTCPAFSTAGDQLFITTARTDLTTEALQEQPYAGGIFSFPITTKGLPDAKVLLP